MLNSAFLLSFFLHLVQIKNTMKHLHKLLLLFTVLTLTSCSTILRTKDQKVYFFSNAENATVTYKDSVYQLPAYIGVFRDKIPTTINYNLNGVEQDTVLKGKVDQFYYLVNLSSLPAFGVGYLADLTNKKRFEYPKRIFLNAKEGLSVSDIRSEKKITLKGITDSVKIKDIYTKEALKYQNELIDLEKAQKDYYKRIYPKKGKMFFNLMLPSLYMMGFSDKNPSLNKYKYFVGGINFGFAWDYFYKEDNFLTVDLSHKVSSFDPFFGSSYEEIYIHKIEFALRKGHKKGRLEYSYGINYNYNFYQYEVPRFVDPLSPVPYTSIEEDPYFRKEHANFQTIGFSGLINYQVMPRIFIGVRYNPSIYTFGYARNGFEYQDVIGLDFRMKF